jgi:hypothetical protein
VTSSGLVVDEVIACPGLGSGDALSRVVQIVTADGQYRSVQVGPDRIQFARTFRPTWALVAGVLGLLVLFLGVLFFLVKTTETAVATIETDHRGTRVRLSGRLDRKVLAILRSTFADPDAAAVAAAQASAVGAPVAAASEAGGSVPLAAPPAPALITGLAPASSVPPVEGLAPPAAAGRVASGPSVPLVAPTSTPLPSPSTPPPFQGPGGGSDATVTTWRPAPQTASSGLSLLFDDGATAPCAGVVLIGRDPAPSDGEEDVRLIAVDDPGRSVSKTHLAVQVDDDAVWVLDRNSTNGTRVVGPGGMETPVLPGHRVPLLPGASVHLGERSFLLVDSNQVSGA